MHLSFPGSTSRSRLDTFDWRARAIVLTALLSSHGCGIIAEAPNEAVSKTAYPNSEPQSGNNPPPPVLPRETPAIAKIPSPPKTETTPPVAKIPAPPQAVITETGLASWYGAKFHGKLTASGEVFNQEKLTAAHPTLPWGSRVKVINLDNGKSVDVRINDRGPFKRGRIIDVSLAAARALGMVGPGITRVRIEWL